MSGYALTRFLQDCSVLTLLRSASVLIQTRFRSGISGKECGPFQTYGIAMCPRRDA